MTDRITGLILNQSVIRNINKHQLEFNRLQNQLSTGKRIQKSSDDPSGAVNQLFLDSRLKELDQFTENIAVANSRLRLIDGRLQAMTQHMQRVRELAVQGGHGIYQGDEGFALRVAIFEEVDQHLRAIVEIANSYDEIGRPLFGGYLIETRPYVKLGDDAQGNAALPIADTDGGTQITNVVFRGDQQTRQTEIERGQFLNPNVSGADVFWASNMYVTAGANSSGYVAARAQQIRIDGRAIDIAAGDTQAAIIDKINATSSLEVNADVVPDDTGAIGQVTLSTTRPHQMFLEDVGDGTVLQDLGLITANADLSNNFSPAATVAGLSLFGMLIQLREDLGDASIIDIGGPDLGLIDSAISNILQTHTDVGSQQKRLEEQEKSLAWDKVYFTELYAQYEAIDFPETITNLRWLETVHQYALNVGARIIQPKLLDFLR